MQSQAVKESWQAFKDTCSLLSSHWLLVVVALVIAGILNSLVPPHTKLIPPMRDPSLSYPVGVEQVPEWLVFVLAVGVPLGVIVLFSHFSDNLDLGVTVLALGQSCSYNMTSTVILKKIAGRPRPCFYEMCTWVETSKKAEIGKETGSCTGPRKAVWESRQSFPSGHSSLAFAGLVFLSLFMLEKLAQHTRRSQPLLAFERSLYFKALQAACLTPIGLACWIAETRTQDYWHNYDDILAGAALGTAFACWFFHQREGYVATAREALRMPATARNSDEAVPMRDSDAVAAAASSAQDAV